MGLYVRPTKRLALVTICAMLLAAALTGFIAYTLGQEAANEAVRGHYEHSHMENSK